MYMTARLLVQAGAINAWRFPTLIVCYRHDQDCEDQPPQAESIDDSGDDAVVVELFNEVSDRGVCRGRCKARVDGHVDGVRLLGASVGVRWKERARNRKRGDAQGLVIEVS
jgi:hypothetical protein